MATIFSEVLTRLRQEAGFPTAYKFYHANGGAPVLQISYRKYLLLEQGKNLPDIGRLIKLFFALQLVPKSFEANELVIAWLKTMAGSENFRTILQPLISESAQTSTLSPLNKAVKRSLAGKRYQLTPAQFRAVLSSCDSYLCFLAISSDTGLWQAENLAKVLKLEKRSAAKALEVLREAGLLKKSGKGLYKCPFGSQTISYPYLNLMGPEVNAKLDAYHQELMASGMRTLQQGCVVRADSAAFREFYPLMISNLSTAQTYSVAERTEKSALYWVEGKIVKLRDF